MEPNQCIGFELRSLAILMKRKMDKAPNECGIELTELTYMHGWAVGYFYNNRNREIFQKDFEKVFTIRRSTASNILNLMEKNGLITRETVDYDTRLKKITLTEKAMRIHNMVINRVEEFEKELSKGIAKEKLDVFFEVINIMKRNIQ